MGHRDKLQNALLRFLDEKNVDWEHLLVDRLQLSDTEADHLSIYIEKCANWLKKVHILYQNLRWIQYIVAGIYPLDEMEEEKNFHDMFCRGLHYQASLFKMALHLDKTRKKILGKQLLKLISEESDTTTETYRKKVKFLFVQIALEGKSLKLLLEDTPRTSPSTV